MATRRKPDQPADFAESPCASLSLATEQRNSIMFGDKSADEWMQQYAQSHQHPVNRFCHTLGIPLITLSIVLFVVAVAAPWLAGVALALFGLGWLLQFVGHAFEGKPPEFFKDWRFLFVGLRWWWAKIRGRV